MALAKYAEDIKRRANDLRNLQEGLPSFFEKNRSSQDHRKLRLDIEAMLKCLIDEAEAVLAYATVPDIDHAAENLRLNSAISELTSALSKEKERNEILSSRLKNGQDATVSALMLTHKRELAELDAKHCKTIETLKRKLQSIEDQKRRNNEKRKQAIARKKERAASRKPPDLSVASKRDINGKMLKLKGKKRSVGKPDRTKNRTSPFDVLSNVKK